jgi:hypothetical protein
MGKVSIICLFLVFALLLEDGSSVRKKTEKEEEEDKKIAEAVNRTLVAEEEEKRKEEMKKRKKTVEDPVQVREDEASPDQVCPEDPLCPDPVKCPEEKTCPEERTCPEEKTCPSCDECGTCPPCGPCPVTNHTEERSCKPCRPCGPCPVNNTTRVNLECPSPPSCTESSGMSVPVAMVVGASISLVTMGAAAAVGLILRYVPPLISGIFFLSIVFVVWFLSSHYPDVAREMGGRVATILREATVALGHRIMAAIQRHQEQVGFPVVVSFFLLFDLSSMFHLEIVCTKIFYVEEN